jgi:hypothetical protein
VAHADVCRSGGIAPVFVNLRQLKELYRHLHIRPLSPKHIRTGVWLGTRAGLDFVVVPSWGMHPRSSLCLACSLITAVNGILRLPIVFKCQPTWSIKSSSYNTPCWHRGALETREGWVVNATVRPFYPRE